MRMTNEDTLREIRERIEQWERYHRETLGAGGKPRFTTRSGFALRPVYTPAELAEAGWDYLADVGLPGEYPYTRGRDAAGYRNAFWHWEFYAGFGSAEEANRRYRFLLDQGATGGVSMA